MSFSPQLRTNEEEGASFIRTDQLDGETDWKLRRSVASTQSLPADDVIFRLRASVYAEKPKKDIYDFVGTITHFGAFAFRLALLIGSFFLFPRVVDPIHIFSLFQNTTAASAR